ncbi:hypothetical protein [Sphingomonas soli]|uniref:hypothetical protein n=1 Tax=Sphingomonas soli TaxID=266127 RepID=UPI00083386ED|nr:hypothetical protein [Sphingomonas soli]
MAHMHTAGSSAWTMRQLRLFAVSLWLTLATAVFCAVVPTGLPQTVRHGSAFNPANNFVAIHASSRNNRAILKRAIDGKPAPAASAGSDVAVPRAQFALAGPAIVQSVAVATGPAAPILSKVPEARFPRGPPGA